MEFGDDSDGGLVWWRDASRIAEGRVFVSELATETQEMCYKNRNMYKDSIFNWFRKIHVVQKQATNCFMFFKI